MMSEYLPVLLQYQALYLQHQIARSARRAALQPQDSVTHNRIHER